MACGKRSKWVVENCAGTRVWCASFNGWQGFAIPDSTARVLLFSNLRSARRKARKENGIVCYYKPPYTPRKLHEVH